MQISTLNTTLIEFVRFGVDFDDLPQQSYWQLSQLKVRLHNALSRSPEQTFY